MTGPTIPGPIICHQLPHHLFLPLLSPLLHLLRPTATYVTSRHSQDGQNVAANPPRHLTNMQRAENDLKTLKTQQMDDRRAEGKAGEHDKGSGWIV